MPELAQFKLDESPVNAVMDKIIMTLRGACDNEGSLVFQSVERGIPLTPVPDDACPAIRVWEDKTPSVHDGQQFLVKESRPVFSFFIFMHQPRKDENGSPVDMQALRNRLVKFFFDNLALPSADNSSRGMTPDPWWNILEPKEGEEGVIEVEHTQAFKKFGDMVAVIPPRYVTRIDIPFEIWKDTVSQVIPDNSAQEAADLEAAGI